MEKNPGITIGVCLMKEEMVVELEMGKEELENLMKNLPQILGNSSNI